MSWTASLLGKTDRLGHLAAEARTQNAFLRHDLGWGADFEDTIQWWYNGSSRYSQTRDKGRSLSAETRLLSAMCAR